MNGEADRYPFGSSAYWRLQLTLVGADAANQAFHEYGASLSENEAHTAAHAFARALYDAEGAVAISYCNEEFAQGCAHEVMAQTISEFGLASIPELQKNCANAFKGGSYFCDHGVGHGLVDYYGYEPPDMLEALAYCDAHRAEDKLNGCYTGVFMEYFLQNVRYSSAVPKPINADQPYDRCVEDKGTARWACFYTLPLWWHQIDKHTGEQSEEKILAGMYARCAAINADIDRVACFHGMGHMVAPMAEYELDGVLTLCRQISIPIPDHLLCISDAAYHILLEKRAPLGLPLCGEYVGAARDYCVAYATTVVQKSIELPLPAAAQ
ncbi:MAG: hypothetical protein KBE09_02200 [Candidatus Pacebacteria bacterium]|nr:hypothetical protein [Candidatus Paceibacterota bacterium]